jgi:hypothetical protein
MATKNTFPCPVCGEDVPVKAKACPHCGACEKSGWNEDATDADGLDLPDPEFNYDEFTAREFGTPRKLKGKEIFWKIAAVCVIVLIILAFAANMLFR